MVGVPRRSEQMVTKTIMAAEAQVVDPQRSDFEDSTLEVLMLFGFAT